VDQGIANAADLGHESLFLFGSLLRSLELWLAVVGKDVVRHKIPLPKLTINRYRPSVGHW
jgi:hypothetical protein